MKESETMSDDQRMDATIDGGDDAGGAPEVDAPGGAGGSVVPGGAEGTDPAEKLDLGGGTSDGDTPSGSTGG